MDNEIQLIGDGDGLAVIGDPRPSNAYLSLRGCSRRTLGCIDSRLPCSGRPELHRRVRRLPRAQADGCN
jgi:hypothetical protein